MINQRNYHACGSFYLGETQVLVVAGGAGGTKVEFLLPNESNPKWVAGMWHRTYLDTFCILFIPHF